LLLTLFRDPWSHLEFKYSIGAKTIRIMYFGHSSFFYSLSFLALPV